MKKKVFGMEPNNLKAYFIKWSTSGEPPVGSKTHQARLKLGSQLRHALFFFSHPVVSHTCSSAMTNLFKICQKVNLIWTNDNQ